MNPNTTKALAAVPAIKSHLDKLMRSEKIDEPELRSFMEAAQVVCHNALANAQVGVYLLDVLMKNYRAQVEKIAAERKGGQ